MEFNGSCWTALNIKGPLCEASSLGKVARGKAVFIGVLEVGQEANLPRNVRSVFHTYCPLTLAILSLVVANRAPRLFGS